MTKCALQILANRAKKNIWLQAYYLFEKGIIKKKKDMEDHYHTENGCLFCMVKELYDKIEELKEDRYRLAVELVQLKQEKEEDMKKSITKKDLAELNKDEHGRKYKNAPKVIKMKNIPESSPEAIKRLNSRPLRGPSKRKKVK